MSRLLTKQLLLSGNYWVLNKAIVQIFGLEAAFLLSNFAEAEQMMADVNGWFYQTSDTVEKMTTLTRHKQDQCIKQLEDMQILEKQVRGMPAKRYFRINYECLTNLIVNNSQTSVLEIDKQDCKKSATNKESSYKESIKESTTRDGGKFKDIVNLFQNNGFGLINYNTSEKLKDLSEAYTDDWVIDALNICIDNNKRNLAYATSILKRWYADGKDDSTSKLKEKSTNSWKVDAT